MATKKFRFYPGRLHVVSPKYADFGGPWPEEPGVRLSVIVLPSNGFVTAICTDSGNSELYNFSDDTGHNLLAQGGGDSAVGISNDRKAALFEIVGRVSPAPKASRITARGRVLISTASGTQRQKSGTVSAKAGATASVAGFVFHIESVTKSTYEVTGLEIELKRNTKQQQLHKVSRIWFEDGAGKQLEVQEVASMGNGVDDDFEVRDRYLFLGQVKSFVIVVEVWVGRVEQQVEYDVSSTIACGM